MFDYEKKMEFIPTNPSYKVSFRTDLGKNIFFNAKDICAIFNLENHQLSIICQYLSRSREDFDNNLFVDKDSYDSWINSYWVICIAKIRWENAPLGFVQFVNKLDSSHKYGQKE